jgi:hypothetical protein
MMTPGKMSNESVGASRNRCTLISNWSPD